MCALTLTSPFYVFFCVLACLQLLLFSHKNNNIRISYFHTKNAHELLKLDGWCSCLQNKFNKTSHVVTLFSKSFITSVNVTSRVPENDDMIVIQHYSGLGERVNKWQICTYKHVHLTLFAKVMQENVHLRSFIELM